MSAEQNIALARRFLAEEDKRGVPPEELCAPGFTALADRLHSPARASGGLVKISLA